MKSALTAANRILEAAWLKRIPLTPLQLMKLTYMSHGWSLGLTGDPLFRDKVEAWKYGPVIPSVYHETKQYGSAPIDESLSAPFGDHISAEEDEIMMSVLENYGHMSGAALSTLTHRSGSPWSKVWKEGSSHLEIGNELIRDHYENLKHSDKVTAA